MGLFGRVEMKGFCTSSITCIVEDATGCQAKGTCSKRHLVWLTEALKSRVMLFIKEKYKLAQLSRLKDTCFLIGSEVTI